MATRGNHATTLSPRANTAIRKLFDQNELLFTAHGNCCFARTEILELMGRANTANPAHVRHHAFAIRIGAIRIGVITHSPSAIRIRVFLASTRARRGTPS